MSEHPGDTSWLPGLAGRFLAFDGPDGSGKSTLYRRFAAHCREAGLEVLEVREPGGTPIGEQVRRILLDPSNAEMTTRCEMLLYMASRAQLVEQRIVPALRDGVLVLADRFISSTLAYQGAAGGIPVAEILAVGEIAVGSAWPELTVILDVDEVTAARRLNPLLDRMEQKGAEFHRRVRRGYLDQVAAAPQRHLLLDATREPEVVWEALLGGLATRYAGASAR